uniref:ZP domain-containing protein n=1 Tax=Elaeophora elaphi TaxID=1147741 RepID=A0A0R3RIN5_9BILA
MCAMKYTPIIVLTLVEIQFWSLQNPFSMSLDATGCLVYHKVNGTIKKWEYDECSIDNHCCFSAITMDQSGKFVVEAGGCQNDFQSFILQHPGIRVHPIDRLPFLGQFSDEKITEYCEFEMCLASAIPNYHWRICACHEENCNEDGIDEMLRKYMAVKPSETSTLSLNVFDGEIEMLLDN